ncbi:MAG TPA: ACT domain-containing protein [Thermoanaerobacterales bacterium]|uniref:ACT domain-containing protein n=1 Tax=Tepidanaerobacter sp. GT38 TaxID=2722793 RepID=UPI00185A07AC|nr:ACT domain-containing protein [Tepidanaerobacter sp. GT38]MCG1013384.1 ACT domain-containing protein [Tepidanaerobacter sp. GT38]HHY43013.1 ACT domain-containing protein [Thermoanaerobacterales bacterium]
MTNKGGFYIVKDEILPDIFKKTVKAKELLKSGKAKTVNEATEAVGMSRSAYYKYKDYVFPFYEASMGKIVTISFILEHIPGVLSGILEEIAKAHGNILTINQNIPVQNMANVTISFETGNLNKNVEELLAIISEKEGVHKLDVIAQG